MSNTFESFIFQTYIDDLNLCDDIIQVHNNSPLKNKGTVGNTSDVRIVNKELKDSTDLSLNIYPELHFRYLNELKKCLDNYVEKYVTCNWHSPFNIIEEINIQHYAPGGGYKYWHTERYGTLKPNSDRHLVFMTYLNDVTDQGGTEFYNQKIITEPKKGLTLIWPADWTHTHRGIVSPTQDKYIVTGWLNYVERTE